jgi:predicted nucleic acid-binding protein
VIAVDTNVVVRFLTEDQPAQAARARRIFEHETGVACKDCYTRFGMGLAPALQVRTRRCRRRFDALISLPRLVCEDLNAVVEALRWMRAGMDFADALHLASVGQADRFATFDRGLIKRAQKVAGIKVVQA